MGTALEHLRYCQRRLKKKYLCKFFLPAFLDEFSMPFGPVLHALRPCYSESI